MSRFFSILAFLGLAFPTAACAGFSLVRGSGPEASFESTARPTVAVKAAPDFFTVSQGKMTVSIATSPGGFNTVPGTVWYCLSARGEDQLAVALANAGSLSWYPGILGTNLASTKILYSCGSDKYGSVTQRVFLRPIQLDPWMGAFAAKGHGWTASALVSQYEWILNNGENKLLVEYREPCPSEHCPVIEDAELKAFLQRANTAFSARFGSNGDIAPSSVKPYPWNRAGVSEYLLTTVLGVATGEID